MNQCEEYNLLSIEKWKKKKEKNSEMNRKGKNNHQE